jgi:hypothetical protein
MTGAPVLCAILNAPFLNGINCPDRERVPSGKVHKFTPSSNHFIPCFNANMDDLRLVRSTHTFPPTMIAFPNMGTFSSSFLFKLYCAILWHTLKKEYPSMNYDSQRTLPYDHFKTIMMNLVILELTCKRKLVRQPKSRNKTYLSYLL